VNWDALGAIAELIGSLAVLATLVYLTFQIRNAREELKHTVRKNNEAAQQELTLESVRNPILARAMAKAFEPGNAPPTVAALQEAYDLEIEEVIVLNNYLAARLRLARATAESDLQFLEESAKRGFERQFRSTFGAGPGKVFFSIFTERTAAENDSTTAYLKKLIDGA
jgi:hypothetical protein